MNSNGIYLIPAQEFNNSFHTANHATPSENINQPKYLK